MKKRILSTLFVAAMSFQVAQAADNVHQDEYDYVGTRFENSSAAPLNEWSEYKNKTEDGAQFRRMDDPNSAIRKMDSFMGGDGGNR